MSLSELDRRIEERIELSPKRIIINIIALYGLGVCVQALPYMVGPFERGFFCDDETIKYDYKKGTVSVEALYVFAIAIPCLATLWGEFVVQAWIDKRKRRYHFRNRSVHSFVVHFLQEFGYSQLGLISVLCFMQVTKFVCGRLRPHFLAVCDIKNFDQVCRDTTKYIHVSEYTCSGSKTEVHEARLSFFSGHSAVSVYTAFYAILYLQAKIGRFEPTKIFVSLAQTILLCGSLVICYTRITDNWHHWSDVVVGISVGLLVATWTAIFWARLFERSYQLGVVLPYYEKHRENSPMTVQTSDTASAIDVHMHAPEHLAIDRHHL